MHKNGTGQKELAVSCSTSLLLQLYKLTKTTEEHVTFHA